MFTKKLEDQFSADLLNTVRSVLGEAKHDKECECEKCEKEDDEDEDETKKEGYVPTADEPTEANKKTAQKIRDMMAKEKKPAKKEVKEEKRGLWDNIHAKRKRIKAGSGERMRKPGSKGAPTDADFKAASEAVDPGLEDELMSQRQGESGKKWRVERAGKIVGTYSSKDKADVKAMKHPLNKVVAKEEAEQIDELSKSTLGSYIKKAAGSVGQEAITAGLKIKTGENPTKNLNKTLRRQKGIEIAANKLTKEEQEFIDSLNNDMFEEIDIAEANLKVGDYMATSEKSKFHDKGYRPHLKNPQGKTSYLASVAYKTPEHAAGEAAAYHKGYTSGPGKASERGADDAVRAYRHKNKEHMHEEVELEEGRGRPPKEGSAAWKARQGKADEDMVALGMQLRKAKSINKKVRFMDGKEHDIHPNHISRFEDHMAARKTSLDKAAFQKQAHKSHADFVKAVSAPVPKAAKDTGEIVKYRH